MHLLESGKVILANNFIYYLRSIQCVNFDENLWDLEFRGTDEGGPNESHTKEISWKDNIKGTVMQIEKAPINDYLRVSNISWKFRIAIIVNYAVIYPWNLLFT